MHACVICTHARMHVHSCIECMRCDAMLSEHVSVRNTNLYTTQRRADRPPRSCRRRSSHTSRRPPSELDQDSPRIGNSPCLSLCQKAPRSHGVPTEKQPRCCLHQATAHGPQGQSRTIEETSACHFGRWHGGRGKRRRRPPPSVISPRSLAAHFQAVSHLPPAMPQGPVHLLAKAAAHQ